jgi:succinate dehydrogenase / fumarate reductase cytochrome b subunit
MIARKNAPRFLNLFLIKLPVSGLASIAHRISGVLLFLSLPVLVWGFGLSLESAAGFSRAVELFDGMLSHLILAIVVWSLSQHLFTGIRHLLLDTGLGVERQQARISAWVVNLAALAVTLLYLVTLL